MRKRQRELKRTNEGKKRKWGMTKATGRGEGKRERKGDRKRDGRRKGK